MMQQRELLVCIKLTLIALRLITESKPNSFCIVMLIKKKGSFVPKTIPDGSILAM